MNDLVIIENDRVMADSREVALRFGKPHKNVLRAIDRLMALDLERRLNFEPTFAEVAGPNGAVRQERYFLMDHDAFLMLVMSFTGAEAFSWKLQFIAAFNAMEEHIHGKALSYERQKDMVLTIKEAFGEDDARITARSYGWPVARKRKALPKPGSSQEDMILERLAKAAGDLARASKNGFTGDELCREAEVMPHAVTPGMWEKFRMFAAGVGLLRGQTTVGGRTVDVWRLREI